MMRYLYFLFGRKGWLLVGVLMLMYACSNEEEAATLRLVQEISGVQRFTWGESQSYAIASEHVDRFIITTKPRGWEVSVDAQVIRITAPQTISGVEGTTGEVVVTASNRGGENPTITIRVEIPTSMIIDLSRPDLFDESEVLLALSAEGDTVAEVCREYVRRNNMVVGQGIRAVVVYLYDRTTKTFQRGFIATNGGGVDHDGGNYQSASVGPLQLVYIVEGVCTGAGNYENVPVARLLPQTVEDVEGNRYGMVKVGTQYWMRENLRTMSYRDGSDIGNDASWYKDMNVDVSSSDKLKKMFGASYTDKVLSNRALAPAGWRAAGDEDWLTLERFLNMSESDLYSTASSRGSGIGDYLKSEGEEWSDKGGGTNLTGLSIMPGGASNNAIKVYAYLWAHSSGRNYCRLLSSTHSTLLRKSGDRGMYFNIRCVREN